MLRGRTRTENRGCDNGLRRHPVQRDLRWRFAEFLRTVDKRVQNFPIALLETIEKRNRPRRGEAAIAFAAVLPFPFVLAGKETAAEWAPWADADAKLLRGRNMLTLDVALDKRIFEL